MDLAVGAKDVYTMMTLFAKDGSSKLVNECTYPLTGLGCVSRIYTDVATFILENGAVYVRETFSMSLEELRSRVPVELLTYS
jgi:3-oxoadipate CoA-transferase beta subunit